MAIATLPLFAFATPIPSPNELAKESSSFKKLTRGEFAALKSGTKTNSDLGATFEDMAEKTEYVPAQYLLFREAFRQYATAGDVAILEKFFDKVIETHGHEYAYSIARWSNQQVLRLVLSNRPEAKDFRKRLGALENRLDRIADLQKKVSVLPDSQEHLRGLAVNYVALGDWTSALAVYEKCGKDINDFLSFERDYPRTGLSVLTTADVGEFWWHEAETCPDDTEAVDQFRRRAAKWYRFAIENGTVQGAGRQLVEKRISEVEWRQTVAKNSAKPVSVAEAVPSVLPGVSSKAAGSKGAGETVPAPAADGEAKPAPDASTAEVKDSYQETEDDVGAVQPAPFVKALPSDLGMSFIACPSATPFWISLDRIDYGSYRKFLEKTNRLSEQEGHDAKTVVLAKESDAEEFCAFLQRWHGSRLPIGYRFRLPTQREWDRLQLLISRDEIKKSAQDTADYSPVMMDDDPKLVGYVRVVIGSTLVRTPQKGGR